MTDVTERTPEETTRSPELVIEAALRAYREFCKVPFGPPETEAQSISFALRAAGMMLPPGGMDFMPYLRNVLIRLGHNPNDARVTDALIQANECIWAQVP